MHRDEVKIFRGNVETHLQRLDSAAQITGPPPARVHHEVETPTPPPPRLALEYRPKSIRDRLQRLRFLRDAQVLACLAGVTTFLFVMEWGRGDLERRRPLWPFGGGAALFWLALAAVAAWKGLRAR